MFIERRKQVRREIDHTHVERRIPNRRVPGTAALATTNLLAGSIVFNYKAYESTQALLYLQKYVSLAVWGSLLFLSGLILLLSIVNRKWITLNIGACVSLFVWGTVALGMFMTWFRASSTLSPIAMALAWWMLTGQLAMLAAPLTVRWQDR